MYRELIERGYLKSNSQKGSLRIAIPSHMASYVFPELIPTLDAKEEPVKKRKVGRPSNKEKSGVLG